jgi:hypothetical protein
VLSAMCSLRETLEGVNWIPLPTRLLRLVMTCWRRRVTDQLVGDIGLDVICQVQVVLGGTDNESL